MSVLDRLDALEQTFALNHPSAVLSPAYTLQLIAAVRTLRERCIELYTEDDPDPAQAAQIYPRKVDALITAAAPMLEEDA